MKRIAVLACVLLIAGLSGCATSYGTEGFTGGYREQQLEPGIWRVTFAGNGFTTAESVQTFWLYRCAELSLEQGYSGFEVISNIQLVSFDGQQSGQALRIPIHGGGGGGFVYIAPGYGVAKPLLQADIRMIKRPFTAKPPKVFDAVALKAKLDPLVKGTLCNGNVCAHVHHYLMPDEDQVAPHTTGS